MTYVQGGQKEPASTVVKDDRKLPDDKALIGLIGRFFSESRSYHDELKKVQDKGEKYYQGEQTDRSMIKKNFSNAVENKIFENIEAIVPMVTSRPAEFVALPGDENEVAEQDADMIQKALSAHLRNLKWIQLLEIAVRRALIVRYGVFKIFWNKDKGLNGDVDISLPNPKDIFIPKFGMKIYDVPFIIENLSMTYEQMIVWFGQEKADLALKQFTSNEEDAKFEMKKVRIINEVWTNEWHAYKIGTVILKSELNPYYNFNETDQNFLEEPCKPYVFLSPYRMGNTIIGDTSSMEQSIPIQDIINSTLRIIFNHTKKMGNGTWMVDSTVMSEEEARNKLSNAAGLVVWGKNVADSAKMRRDAPIPLPRGFDNVLAQAERTMDNLWGTHSVTRGEQLPTRETLGAKQQQQQSDISRQGLLVREIEQCTAEVAQWIVQLMKMFYDEEHILPMVGEAMNVEFLKFTKDKIRRGMKIIVREGSTIPSDPITERTEALDLYKMQAIGILQLHKKLKFPNPEQSAQEAMLWWKQGQLPQAQPTPPVIPNQPFGGQPMQPGANPMQPASNPAPAVAPTPAPVQ